MYVCLCRSYDALITVDLRCLSQEQWKGQTCANCQVVGACMGLYKIEKDPFKFEVGPFCRALVNVWCEMCFFMSRALLKTSNQAGGYTYERALQSTIEIVFDNHSFTISLVCKGLDYLISSFKTIPLQAYSTENTVYGRPVCDIHIDIELISRWIHCCDSWHQGSCHSGHTTGKASDSSSLKNSVRLIDVDLECLVIQSSSCRYVALSYVWGVGRTLTLKSEVRVF